MGTEKLVEMEKMFENQQGLIEALPPRETVVWSGLIADVLALLPSGMRQGVSFRLDRSLDDVPGFAVPRPPLLYALVRLVTNAVESVTRAGVKPGEVCFSVRSEREQGHEGVTLRIEDNGAGIESEDLVKVFDRSYSSKTGRGHGEGLGWCVNALFALGGSVRLLSPGPGRGAVAEVFLPQREDSSGGGA